MEAVREITEWAVDYRQPNHEYLLDGDKIIAYRKWGEGPVIPCSGKLKLDRRGRKFQKLEHNPFDSHVDAAENTTVEVRGSKGNSYFVDKEARTCTCPGFTFRGACKHVVDILGE